MTRNFHASKAVRGSMPILMGLIGPSGSGKTFSALRLAKGFQRVMPGKVFVIDNNANRARHYADIFDFEHVPFGPPFGPSDYQQAIEYCVKLGAAHIIVDSTSDEHDGVGGVLEMHDTEMKRLAKLWKKSEDAAKMAAWGPPKTERKRLIGYILRQPINFIFCFRAKEKLELVSGEKPKPLGFMPVAGEEWIYEMVLKCLLMPGSDGTPTWLSQMPGEKLMMKLPLQFRELFKGNPQLSEDLGEKIAKWHAGGAAAQVDPNSLLDRYAACADPATLRDLETSRQAVWKVCTADTKTALKKAADDASARLKAEEQRQAAAAKNDDGSLPEDPPEGAPIDAPGEARP